MLPLHHIASCSAYLTEKPCQLFVDMFPESILCPNKNGLLPFHHAYLNDATTIDVSLCFLSLFLESLQTTENRLHFHSK